MDVMECSFSGLEDLQTLGKPLNMCSCLQPEVFHNTLRFTGTHTLRQRWLCRCTDAEDIADDHPGMCGRSTQAGRQQEEGAGCV